LQIDSTQDVSVVDQAAVCIRYIYEGEVKERLFALLKVVDSSGNGYYNMLKQLFSEHSIKFNNIIGESFDGAANMRGEYSGLQSKIKNQENPKAIYIWCYSHVLNLCICDTCKSLEAKNLFGFLNRLSTFFSESYKRMLVWLQEINSSLGSNKLKKLQKIWENNTRWWSREKALYWIFDGDYCLFPIIICALYHISISSNFEPKTKGMDLLSAWGMIDSIKQEIGRLSFDCILNKSINFSNNMNDLLSSMNLPDDILVSSTFPVTRKSRKKRMYDEICEDESPELPLDKFRVDTYQTIIDQITISLNERFTDNNKLIADVQYLLPKNFKLIEQMPNTALKHLANLANLEHIQLCLELKNFSKVYPKINMSTIEKTKQIYHQLDTESDENTDDNEENMYENTAFP
ncbi:zinc finger MYM-type protein 1-like, partial [Myzus persicae]|uniref:zinc finger MYM-type protein 1-like n=1 Tax=Myzus persicae TaxID=13164 RepID=UPI000B9354EE